MWFYFASLQILCSLPGVRYFLKIGFSLYPPNIQPFNLETLIKQPARTKQRLMKLSMNCAWERKCSSVLHYFFVFTLLIWNRWTNRVKCINLCNNSYQVIALKSLDVASTVYTLMYRIFSLLFDSHLLICTLCSFESFMLYTIVSSHSFCITFSREKNNWNVFATIFTEKYIAKKF